MYEDNFQKSIRDSDKRGRGEQKNLGKMESSLRSLALELPILNFDLSYSGKIMVFAVQNSTVIRGNGTMHKDIVREFDNELKSQLGPEFRKVLNYSQKGGARFRCNQERNKVIVYSESVDYGPIKIPDQVEDILKEVFPDSQVRVERRSKL